MISTSNDITELKIKDLFSRGDRYLIPVYQRNYAWGKTEIEQLILDIKDYYLEESDKPYYIGTLIVNRLVLHELEYYETIDGQQRLTTFNILCCAIQTMTGIDISQYFQKPVISFASRENADQTIQHIFRNGSEQPKFDNFSPNIFEGLKLASTFLEQLQEELSNTKNKSFEGFIHYLFNKVTIVRVQVPPDTDLNHYFEIMNSRGEQLEKHEILKARMMRELNSHAEAPTMRRAFNMIWEACADMNSYIQLSFKKEYRNALFGEKWFHFQPTTSESLFHILTANSIDIELSDEQGVAFSEVISLNSPDLEQKIKQYYDDDTTDESASSQFQPIINFENFLLHVVKIQCPNDSVSLDDKRLLDFFKAMIDEKFVCDFAYNLLKMRFLLDQYVIKREYINSESNWGLQCVKYYAKDEGRQKDTYSYVHTFEHSSDELIMLLSMFHVSTPTLVYKNWLFATLRYLHQEFRQDVEQSSEKPLHIDGYNYILFLRNLAKKFMIFRFLSSNPKDYDEIILGNIPDAKKFSFEHKLRYGAIANNLVFNYLDYLLWMEDKASSKYNFSDFAFSFRSSVEHYYPQQPISGEVLNNDQLLHSYGNLCLISHGNNSRLSNHLPAAKEEFYRRSGTKDSLKQELMMRYKNWTALEIEKHHNEMILLLDKNLF